MNPSELLVLAQRYMDDKALIVIVVLNILGYVLKRTPFVKNWMIPWILVASGIILACSILQSLKAENVMQGILAAGIATLTHQLWKQTAVKRKES